MSLIELKNGQDTLRVPCPECGLETESIGYKTTLVGYVSTAGHDHDDNCRCFSFTCQKGHHFSVLPVNTCPTKGCSWRGRDSCWCHTPQVKEWKKS